MKALTGVLLCLPFIGWAATRIILYLLFGINCGGHMERAGMANSIDLARQEMQIVVKYAEDKELTSGYTSVLYCTPKEDLGFWYTNMKSSLTELQNVKPGATDLEKSNILIKLRETISHHEQSEESLNVPDGISIAPHNLLFLWWSIISGIFAGIGAILIGLEFND